MHRDDSTALGLVGLFHEFEIYSKTELRRTENCDFHLKYVADRLKQKIHLRRLKQNQISKPV